MEMKGNWKTWQYEVLHSHISRQITFTFSDIFKYKWNDWCLHRLNVEEIDGEIVNHAVTVIKIIN